MEDDREGRQAHVPGAGEDGHGTGGPDAMRQFEATGIGRKTIARSRATDGSAFDRYKIIAPLYGDGDAKVPDYHQLRHEIAIRNDISDRTVARYCANYEKNGLDGLRPRSAGRPGARSIPPGIIDEAIFLRRQLPARSVNTLIRILELNGRVEKGEIRRSTLQDQLTARGYGGAQMRIYADQKDTIGAMRFQHPVRNSLWQSDFKDGPFIDGKPTFFIAFIDDCSRYIVHGEFCHGHNKEIVMASLYRAIQKYGTPKALYFDRGGEFRSRAISRTCSSLNIRVRYTKPRSPASKGKIERYNRTIESFIIESKLGDVKNLEHFNVLFKAWLEECYHSVGHAGLGDGRSPSEAFHGDKEPLRLMDPEFFRKAFLVVEENRRVDKSGCVSFGRGKHVIEGGTGMIGRKVSVVYHCVAPQDVWVEHGGFPPRKATPLAIGEWAARRPGPPPFAEPAVADGSMLLDGALRAHGEREGDPPGQAGRGEGAGPAPDPDPGPAASAAEDAHGGPGPRTGPDPGGQAHASMLLSAAVRESERRGQRSRAAISFKDMLKKKER